MAESNVEPWLRGTLTEVGAVPRAVVHALQLAQEDVTTWCGSLSDTELNQHPLSLPPVAFHIRHISRSIDRLLTCVEGGQLSPAQITALQTEMEGGASLGPLFVEFATTLEESTRRVRALASANLESARGVGRKMLPTTVGGLLVHIADHTQRHVGQAVTTAKFLLAGRSE